MYADWQEVVKAVMHENDDNCCTVVATALACNVRFSKAKRVLARIAGRRKGRGVPFMLTHDRVFEALGHKLVRVECPAKTVITIERWAKSRQNVEKVFLVYVRGHVLTIRRGEVVDHTKGSKKNIREVYEVLPMTEEH